MSISSYDAATGGGDRDLEGDRDRGGEVGIADRMRPLQERRVHQRLTAGVEDLVVRDRRHLSSDGVVVPVVVVDKQTGALESLPEIVSRGFMDRGPEAELLAEAERVVAEAVEARPADERHDSELTKERVRQGLRRFLKRRTQRRPMVIPVVMEV